MFSKPSLFFFFFLLLTHFFFSSPLIELPLPYDIRAHFYVWIFSFHFLIQIHFILWSRVIKLENALFQMRLKITVVYIWAENNVRVNYGFLDVSRRKRNVMLHCRFFLSLFLSPLFFYLHDFVSQLVTFISCIFIRFHVNEIRCPLVT